MAESKSTSAELPEFMSRFAKGRGLKVLGVSYSQGFLVARLASGSLVLSKAPLCMKTVKTVCAMPRPVILVAPSISVFAAAQCVGVEFIPTNLLLIDSPAHVDVPNYAALSEPEVQQLLAKRKVKRTDLPRMYTTDPQAVIHGFKLDMVVRLVDEEDAYRVVVEPPRKNLAAKASDCAAANLDDDA